MTDANDDLVWWDPPKRPPAIVPTPTEPDDEISDRARRWAVVIDGGAQHAADTYRRSGHQWARIQCLGVTVVVDDLHLISDTEQPGGWARVCRHRKCQRIFRELQQKGTP